MKSRYPVTLILIGINVVVFALIAWQQKTLLMSSNADVFAILNAGANLNPFTLGGQPWRIISCVFLHFGIIHLAVNMYGLFALGSMLEPGIGSYRFLILYFICGLAASIASLYFNIYVISAGASGAIFGLYGYQLGAELISTYHDREKLTRVLINFGIFVVINAFIAGQVSIDMSGHIGGAVAGLILAACHFKLGVLKSRTAMVIVLLVLPCLLFSVSKDQVHFYRIFQRVIHQESYTDKLFREIKDNSALKDSLQQVQAEWKNIHMAFRDLTNVRTALREDTATLYRYVMLRNREVDYRLHVLDQSYIYLDSIETVNARFDSLPKLQHIKNFNFSAEDAIVTPDTIQQEHLSATGRPTQVLYDKDWKETDNDEEARYYRIGTRDSLGRWQGSVRDYFKNGDLQMKGAYTNGLRSGIFIYYTDRHTYSSAGRYERERAVGKWENFHWNGKLAQEVFYAQRSFIKTVWDSLGTIQVADGNGNYRSRFANGALKEEGMFRNGHRTGYWFGYREDGKPYYKEMYEDNRLIKGLSEDKGGRQYVYDGFSELPVPVMGYPKYSDHVERSKKIPADDSARGLVKVLFTVGVDGALWNFVILESVSPLCDLEAIRVIREGPPWRPALIHGQEKVQSQGYIEVRF
jgi:membrane associated rhomboid family serine protease